MSIDRVTLLTRSNCHLCDAAREALHSLAATVEFGWREVDVDSDPELSYEYGDRVPVVLLDGAEHGFWQVDPARLLRDLDMLAA